MEPRAPGRGEEDAEPLYLAAEAGGNGTAAAFPVAVDAMRSVEAGGSGMTKPEPVPVEFLGGGLQLANPWPAGGAFAWRHRSR